MKRILCSIDALFRFSLFTVLGLAIFLGGCTYSHTQRYSSTIEASNIELREHIEFEWSVPPSHKKYTGPQNVRELMEALDANYNRTLSKTEVSVVYKGSGIKTTKYSSRLTESEVDARYPRSEWLHMILDRGVTIEDFGDYSRYLLKRHTLALFEDNPNLWQSGLLGIPQTDDWETYKEAYINKLVKDRKITVQIERSKKEIELTKARIKHSKEQIERVIERNKAEIERAKAQLEQSKVQLEHARRSMNSQQLEHARKQFEHAKEQLKHIQGTLAASEGLIPPVPPIPPYNPNKDMKQKSSYPPL